MKAFTWIPPPFDFMRTAAFLPGRRISFVEEGLRVCERRLLFWLVSWESSRSAIDSDNACWWRQVKSVSLAYRRSPALTVVSLHLLRLRLRGSIDPKEPRRRWKNMLIFHFTSTFSNQCSISSQTLLTSCFFWAPDELSWGKQESSGFIWCLFDVLQ